MRKDLDRSNKERAYDADSPNREDVFRRARPSRRADDPGSRAAGIEVSVVVPVFNGAQTIERVVDEICSAFADRRFEIILVNDGSTDASEHVCTKIVEQYPGRVFLLQLAKNFGEHNAVMAGLKHASGDYATVLDDDGQNNPADALRMLEHARDRGLDVVYGRYCDRKHPPLRILGSCFNDRVAQYLLNKPAGLYLSSFKVMSRLVVDEVCRYSGPMPYIDGLILRATRNVGQIDVPHRQRIAGRSGYTLAKLVGLWMNMFMGFSLRPVRALTLVGLTIGLLGILGFSATTVNELFVDPSTASTAPLLSLGFVTLAGIQIFVMGLVGEYVARIFLHQGGMPQYVLRYMRVADAAGQAQTDRQRTHKLRYNAG